MSLADTLRVALEAGDIEVAGVVHDALGKLLTAARDRGGVGPS